MNQYRRDEGAATPRVVRARRAGMAIGPLGFVLLGVGMAADWPWVVLVGVLFSFASAALLISAFAARAANRA